MLHSLVHSPLFHKHFKRRHIPASTTDSLSGPAGTMTRPWTGRSADSYLARAKGFYFLRNVQTCSGTHSAPHSTGTGILSRGYRDVKQTTHQHTVPRSRMHGAIPLLPGHAFMAQTRTTPPFFPKEQNVWWLPQRGWTM